MQSRKGLIYGPFTPVYGAGAVVYYLILKNVNTKSSIKVFFATAILGGITEYLCSFAQEKIFETISWDYSNLLFNINGRTSLLHCTYWGIIGVIAFKYIYPAISDIEKNINIESLKKLTIALSIFMIFDISLSFVAANRQTERRNDIPPGNKFETFIDKHYPDEYMDKIYSNKKEVI